MVRDNSLYIMLTNSDVLKSGMSSRPKRRKYEVRWGLGDGSIEAASFSLRPTVDRTSPVSLIDEMELQSYLESAGFCPRRCGEFRSCKNTPKNIKRLYGVAKRFGRAYGLNVEARF